MIVTTNFLKLITQSCSVFTAIIINNNFTVTKTVSRTSILFISTCNLATVRIMKVRCARLSNSSTLLPYCSDPDYLNCISRKSTFSRLILSEDMELFTTAGSCGIICSDNAWDISRFFSLVLLRHNVLSLIQTYISKQS